ncbi:MAG: matrixin family metalloprotease [Myxococcaceae bacterium]|nr:MAG: matrixin family metalloprotease [Myxococcaceae bacterium]
MRLLPIALALAPLALLSPASAQAYCRTTTCGSQPDPTMCSTCGSPVAWERACIGLRVDPRVLPTDLTAAAFHAHVVDSARAWSSFTCPGSALRAAFTLTVLDDFPVPVGYFEGQPNINSVAFRDHWGDDAFHAPDAAAITIVTFTSPSARILDADTELNLRTEANPRGFVFATDGRANAADLPTIVTHELGHTQGLAHSAERSAVMWYSAGRGEQRRVPTDDDRAGLCTIYPPRVTEACVPDPGLVLYSGSGLTCGVSARTTSAPWALLLALAALVTRWGRASSGPRRATPAGEGPTRS